MQEIVHKPVSVTLPDYGVWVSESVHGPGFRMSPERHEFHQIYVVQRGQIRLNDERMTTPLSMPAGTLWPIPAGIAHRMEDTAESILLLIGLSASFIEGDPSRGALWKALCVRRAGPIRAESVLFTQIVTTMNQLLAEQWQQRPGFSLLIQAEIDRLLVRLTRMQDSPMGDTASERVARVLEQIDTQFYEVWDIDRAAGIAHLSRRRFTTVFRALTGQTFNDHLTAARLRHAKALMSGGLHSIPGAAFASGMADVSHFYRLFKKENGCTPGVWISRRENKLA